MTKTPELSQNGEKFESMAGGPAQSARRTQSDPQGLCGQRPVGLSAQCAPQATSVAGVGSIVSDSAPAPWSGDEGARLKYVRSSIACINLGNRCIFA